VSRTCTLKVALSVHKCLIRLFILSISVLVSYSSHLLFLNPIYEDSETYRISTSSLIMEVEAVTHALRRIASRDDSRTTHAILLTDSMNLVQTMTSGMGGTGWNVSMVDTHLRKFLCVYCPGHPAEKGDDRADRLTGKATTSSDLRLRRSEVLRSLKHCIRAQSQGHHTNGRLDERGAERGSARRSSSKG